MLILLILFFFVHSQVLRYLPAKNIHILRNCILQMELSKGLNRVSAGENKVIYEQDKSV